MEGVIWIFQYFKFEIKSNTLYNLFFLLLYMSSIFQLDSAWIIYNRPQTSELTNEHAGFLMGLGLNGHLKNLAILNLHDYLVRVS